MKLRKRDRFSTSAEERFFFHNESFLFYREDSFFYEWEEDGEYIRIPFRTEGPLMNSLTFSSFGGFDLSETIDKTQLGQFLMQMEHMPETGIERIRIRTFPACYSPAKWEIQHNALLEAGYKVLIQDVNMHLNVGQSSFRSLLASTEKRYLNRAQKEKWLFKKLDWREYLTDCYDLFLEARAHKGYPISMNLTDLEDMYRHFPDEFLLFGVFHAGTLIASATCIRVNSGILYVFYHGDRITYRAKSPVVSLYSGLYDFARSNGMTILDQGICTHMGVVNEGLCRFKQNLGGIESPKITYEKEI